MSARPLLRPGITQIAREAAFERLAGGITIHQRLRQPLRSVCRVNSQTGGGMLKKIIAIRDVGRFVNSAAPGDTQLLRRTLVLGPNGFGKSTICDILRSLRGRLGRRDRPQAAWKRERSQGRTYCFPAARSVSTTAPGQPRILTSQSMTACSLRRTCTLVTL